MPIALPTKILVYDLDGQSDKPIREFDRDFGRKNNLINGVTDAIISRRMSDGCDDRELAKAAIDYIRENDNVSWLVNLMYWALTNRKSVEIIHAKDDK